MAAKITMPPRGKQWRRLASRAASTSTRWGTYTYDKRLDDGVEPVHVKVYLLEVEKVSGKWRKKDQRRREWVSTAEAAKRVDEDGLTEIIRQLDVTARDNGD